MTQNKSGTEHNHCQNPRRWEGGRSLISLQIKNLERFLQNTDGKMYATYGTDASPQTQSVFLNNMKINWQKLVSVSSTH